MTIEKLISLGFRTIQITLENRRTDSDNAGYSMKKGNYAMWNYILADAKGSIIKSDWPGFLRSEDMIVDIENKLKND